MYEGAANWYLIPTLGARKIGALTPADISKLVEHMRNTKSAAGREGLSARTTQVAVSTLKAATSWALKNGLIGRDPLQGVDRPRLDQKPMASWTVEQARTFLTHSADDRLATAWALFLARGPRRGEVAGLCWDAVDLDTGSLQVVKTLISVDGKALDSIPKTGAGRRTIPLDTSLVTLLRTHGVAQKAARLRAGQAWQGTGHVFTDELGRPYHPDHFSARFDKLVSETELPRIRLHDLRHTAASLMLASGVPVKVVQEMLGHSSPAITLSLYAHTTPSMAEKAGAALSERLLGSR
jgi:integrase